MRFKPARVSVRIRSGVYAPVAERHMHTAKDRDSVGSNPTRCTGAWRNWKTRQIQVPLRKGESSSLSVPITHPWWNGIHAGPRCQWSENSVQVQILSDAVKEYEVRNGKDGRVLLSPDRIFITAGSVMVNAPVCKTGTRRVNIAGSNPALPILIKYGSWGCKVWPPACHAGNQMGSIPMR